MAGGREGNERNWGDSGGVLVLSDCLSTRLTNYLSLCQPATLSVQCHASSREEGRITATPTKWPSRLVPLVPTSDRPRERELWRRQKGRDAVAGAPSSCESVASAIEWQQGSSAGRRSTNKKSEAQDDAACRLSPVACRCPVAFWLLHRLPLLGHRCADQIRHPSALIALTALRRDSHRALPSLSPASVCVPSPQLGASSCSTKQPTSPLPLPLPPPPHPHPHPHPLYPRVFSFYSHHLAAALTPTTTATVTQNPRPRQPLRP